MAPGACGAAAADAGRGRLAAVLAGALVLPRAIWPYTRMLVTITHEGAHGVAALLTGRRLQGIRLHSDTSGLTVSSGRASGPGMVTMLIAGYLGQAVVGLGAAGLLIARHSLGLLWLFVTLLGLLLVQIRNFYGFVLVVGCAVVLILVGWYLPATMPSGLAYVLTWTLLLAAPKPCWSSSASGGPARRPIPTRSACSADPGSGQFVDQRVPGRQLCRIGLRGCAASAGSGRAGP